MIHLTAKLSEEVSRKSPTENMMVELATCHTDPEYYNTHHHRQTEGLGQTDRAAL